MEDKQLTSPCVRKSIHFYQTFTCFKSTHSRNLVIVAANYTRVCRSYMFNRWRIISLSFQPSTILWSSRNCTHFGNLSIMLETWGTAGEKQDSVNKRQSGVRGKRNCIEQGRNVRWIQTSCEITKTVRNGRGQMEGRKGWGWRKGRISCPSKREHNKN